MPPLGDDYEGRSQARQDMEALFLGHPPPGGGKEEANGALTEQPGKTILPCVGFSGFDVVFSRGLAAGCSRSKWRRVGTPSMTTPTSSLKGALFDLRTARITLGTILQPYRR